ncbi:MAG: hypothetical protein H8M99_15755 [Gloeobacteraceae cyanobacterium ES-bin-144]|nr:hypothetical protein [Verrucomicrobiales bacterium]
MTSTRYLAARVAQAFGYVRKNVRMGDAAAEMHLLREAEEYLGHQIWNKAEEIEALSVEYWNLRKLMKERDALNVRVEACQKKLDLAHEERINVMSLSPEAQQELLAERSTLLNELEKYAQNRDQVVAEAREIRRTYVGLKMKLEVLTNESDGSDAALERVKEVKSRLSELKVRFAELKEERLQIGELIEKGDSNIDRVEQLLREKKQNRRDSASEAFQVISEANKELSLLRSEFGLIDTRMKKFYSEIGRYVSRNAVIDPSCAEASLSQHNLVDVMRALRHSIALNHRLGGVD